MGIPLCLQVVIVSAAADPSFIEAAKASQAAATGAATNTDDSTELTVRLQRPSLFTYNKVLIITEAG